ncbi:MAG TPA: hypothetical protein VFO49_05615 [Nocardioides sp.]|nr:hypothetical protein [Nocardioides sp.]
MKVLPFVALLLALSGCAAAPERSAPEPASFQCCPGGMTRTMSVVDSSVTRHGGYELTLEISNPGPETMTVVVRPRPHAESRWRPTQRDVPGGAVERLTVVGRGPPGCGAIPPWETGDLLVNGAPVVPAVESWCR